MRSSVTIIKDTLLKTRPIQSTQLPKEEVVSVKEGTTIPVAAYQRVDGHIKFTIWKRENDIQGRNTWYVFDKHAELRFDGSAINKVPTTSTVPSNLSVPIVRDGRFTWAEATHGGSRMPPNKQVLENMILLATDLEKARDLIAKPFNITSWYRPPEINRSVGGARNSQHLYGLAVDFWVEGMSAKELARRLSYWEGGLGIYSNMPDILHLDAREGRARWGPGF